MKQHTAVSMMVREFGVSRLARALGMNRQPIQRWRRIPAERVLSVEAATGIRREVWRPDLYPAEE